LSGKNALNSLKSCAASVLLGDITSVGRRAAAMTLAIVYVLPEPVTPRRTTWRRPDSTWRERSAIACGWSPRGS
jgi:hypothetical protein